jgi:YD repeat-containing protein
MTEAAYTGVLSGTYTYQYDAVGNRIYHSNNVTTTETISYTYDAANRLLESVDLTTSEVTTYDWDDASRLITTTVGSNVTRVYQYSQDGDLLQADVDGLVTTFAYDGNGQRLQLSIAGEATTFLPDYSGRSNRVLFEQGPDETKQYLYGVACLGEYVTDNATSESEWRYYQRDGRTLVRQTTNQTATITLAWTFSPEGGVVLGEEGPVTHLGCQDDAVYDWSTGLIFKSGRYFDPSLGIWLACPALIVWSTWRPRKRRKGRKGNKSKGQIFLLLVALLLVTIPLTGCNEPGPTPTICPTPDTTPPGLPPGTPGLPDPTSEPIPTETPEPTPTETSTPAPPPTQPPPTSTPLPPTQPLPTPLYNDTNLYNYQIRHVGAGDNLLYYIEVNYSEGSWAFYTTQSGYEAGTVRIPVRSTDLEWRETYAETYSGLEAWEIGDRNIVAEMSAAIQNRKEYATADAIAIAYSPYNRSNSIGTSWSGKDVIDLLLGEGASGQYAGSSFPVDENGNPLPYNYLAVEPVRFRGADTFEFALIVAYGVDQGYLWDPSFGSMNYAHRTPPDGPLYVRNPGSPQTTFGMMRERGIIP